jgi:hypothetical protein
MNNLIAAVLCVLASASANAVPPTAGDLRTAIFPEEKASALVSSVSYSPPDGIVSYWRPSLAQIPTEERKLEAFLRERAQHEEPLVWKWQHYMRQVAGIVIGGKKLVFVSYYYAGTEEAWAQRENIRKEELQRRGQSYSPDWWRSKPLLVMDGGYRYFRVVYDPSTEEFVWYEQNGDA